MLLFGVHSGLARMPANGHIASPQARPLLSIKIQYGLPGVSSMRDCAGAVLPGKLMGNLHNIVPAAADSNDNRLPDNDRYASPCYRSLDKNAVASGIPHRRPQKRAPHTVTRFVVHRSPHNY